MKNNQLFLYYIHLERDITIPDRKWYTNFTVKLHKDDI